MYIVRTQPGGRGGQAIVINFITVQGGGGVKKGQKLAYVLCTQPLRTFGSWQAYICLFDPLKFMLGVMADINKPGDLDSNMKSMFGRGNRYCIRKLIIV